MPLCGSAACAPLPVMRDLELVARAHHRTLGDAELADLHAGPIVGAEDRVTGKAVEEAVLDHLARAGAAFLAGLEDQVQGAVEVRMPRQVLGSGEQHGGMAVMAACMHLARMPRPMGEGVVLLQRQRVHVGAQPDRTLAGAAAQRADEAGAADAGGHLVAPFRKLFRHHLRGPMLLEAQFRMGVNVPPYGLDLRLQIQDTLREQHVSGARPPEATDAPPWGAANEVRVGVVSFQDLLFWSSGSLASLKCDQPPIQRCPGCRGDEPNRPDQQQEPTSCVGPALTTARTPALCWSPSTPAA